MSARKVAVWRYGMALQTAEQSTVGGGLLSERVLDTLLHQGHDVTVVGPLAKGSKLGVRHAPTLDLSAYDAAVILTGPYNPLYGDSAFDTYRRLARFSGDALYLQWDVALPFHFNAMASPKAAAMAGLPPTSASTIMGKRWHVLTQTSEAQLRAKKAKSVGYNDTRFTHVPCLFELEQLGVEWRDVRAAPRAQPCVVYFGSDRPQRVEQVLRYLCSNESPSSMLYGRWNAKNLQRLAMHSMRSPTCAAPVHEREVVRMLGLYASTLYIADRDYVQTDFLAQRLFENAVAGVPVIYGAPVQPSVVKHMGQWIANDAKELRARHEEIVAMRPTERGLYVERQRERIQALATARKDTLANALKQVLA